MLRLFYSRADRDQDRFAFDKIRSQLKLISETGEGKVLLIVPDQFTLQAERNAFNHLKVPGLMDIDIMSFSRLGAKVLDEVGGATRAHVDKYGRHMLLAKVAAEQELGLVAFKGLSQKHAFLDMVNNLISEMKQFNIRPEDLSVIEATLPEGSILKDKLKDINRIYTRYEALILGKYSDTEDYLDLFISKISRSAFIGQAEIWIDGFDYYTPKMLAVINELIKTARNVHVVMTLDPSDIKPGAYSDEKSRDRDLFALPLQLRLKFQELAIKSGSSYSEETIGADYKITAGSGNGEKAAEIIHLEQEIYAYPHQVYKMHRQEKGRPNTDTGVPALTFCQCSNYYSEAETVAAMIREYVRTGNMRYRDILVICNDMENRASIIRRTFEEYDLPFFLDQKRTIIHNPCIEYISALMAIIAGGWRYEDVFRLIKTGLTALSPDEAEKLDNYAYKYRIKGNRWKSDFRIGKKDEGEEALALLNLSRRYLHDLISGFEKHFIKAITVSEKTRLLYDFLAETADIPARAETLISYLRANNALEYAEETQQIWDVIVAMLDQLVLLIGDSEISQEDYSGLLQTGFEAVEIGILPPTADQIIVGTMQRTRTGPIKALFVIGANDGVLPASNSTEGLLSEDEKAVLIKGSFEITRSDDLRVQEEKMAIYRTLSKPSAFLWVGYSASDLSGREIRPSIILSRLRRIFPEISLSKDILNGGEPASLVASSKSTLRHMTEALRQGYEDGRIDPLWQAVYNWFQRENGSRLSMIKSGMLFDNKVDHLGTEYIKKLYGKGEDLNLTISPSRLESFSKCPFSYFINYGLKAEEREIFEVTGREMGDIYHDCLKRLSCELTMEGVAITAEQSPWMQISQEACEQRIGELVAESAAQYKEGILSQGEAEQYRQGRLRSVCSKAAWMMITHVKKGDIKQSFFEIPFGGNEQNSLPPITVTVEKERVYIAGKIDRMDLLGGPDHMNADGAPSAQDFVKIIDYKSGDEKFNLAEAAGGWRLQLMLYLRAAQSGLPAKPAGAFYFKIDESLIEETLPGSASPDELAAAQEALAESVKRKFRMDGVVVNNPQILQSIAGDFSGSSEVIAISRNKEGEITASSGKLLTEEAFTEFQEAVDETIEKLCASLVSGNLDITPKKISPEMTACTYCKYKSICNFDLSFSGCRYIKIN